MLLATAKVILLVTASWNVSSPIVTTKKVTYKYNNLLIFYLIKSLHHVLKGMIDRNKGGIVFIDGPGKTYLLNLFLLNSRPNGKLIMASASSGISARLLKSGTTAHMRFRASDSLKRNLNVRLETY